MKKEKFCKKAHIKPGIIKRVKKLLTIIDNINRLRILSLFKKHKELSVCDILNSLKLRQNLGSYHLRVLRQAKLVSSEKRGSKIYYRENKKNIQEILKIINDLF
ncbi:MAG: metalloregulator ArsR/SmtB family transcription factor [Xanthomonadaceae bacterium]|nr:metalloregulator ArsR/SmtB family transcription factor [Rhodospirillaceae bacterium]NIA17569.1 metalloregulator ArsR/SmtB family transcription factor [Xanthomonadaceae bacterium]